MKTLLYLLSLTLPILVVNGFSWPWSFQYHDNKVIFSGNITNVRFTIRESKVTSGQDPHNHLMPGTTLRANRTSPNRNELTFKAGRHGSTQVAEWFNRNIYIHQNTFGHGAHKLNFAVIGDLSFSVVNVLGTEYVFHDIAIAQGHAGLSNNWWFGGRNCLRRNNSKFIEVIDPSNIVECTGVDFFKNQVTMKFGRGHNRGKHAVPRTIIALGDSLTNAHDSVSASTDSSNFYDPSPRLLANSSNTGTGSSARYSPKIISHLDDELFLVGGLEEGALGSLYWDDEHGSSSSDPGYLWSRADLDPWHARWDPQRQRWDWIFYLPDSLDPRWFWNFRTGEWEAH